MAAAASVRSGLEALGWTTQRARDLAALASAGLEPCRVSSAAGAIHALGAHGPIEVVLQRRFRRSIASSADLPVTGDWLAVERLGGGSTALRAILPRRGHVTRADTSASRPDARIRPQVLAANVDVGLLVSAVGRDLNPRRIERYLLVARSGGIRPVIVLNKVDLAIDLAADIARIAAVAGDVPIIATSALEHDGLDALRREILPGTTGCLLGSSGVGKSTIINALLGVDRQTVRAARADDDRGRHATTRRELIALPGGGLLIDTPGLRAVGVWDDGTGLGQAFEDVGSLAAACRFRDCRHEREPGCAVRVAVATGELAAARLEDMRKLEREVRSLELRSDVRSARAEARRLGRLYRDVGKAIERKGWHGA